jgi:hypothetical protein
MLEEQCRRAARLIHALRREVNERDVFKLPPE